MTATSPWVTRYMPALCAGAWLVTLAAAIWDVDAHWPLRILLTALAVALVSQIIRGPAPFVAASPFITLPLIILVFFSLVPAFLLTVAAENTFITSMAPDLWRLFTEFFTGQGEFIVLQFGAMCLTGAALLHRHMRTRRPSATAAEFSEAAISRIAIGASILILSLSLFLVIFLPNGFLNAGFEREIKDGIPPVVSFALATLFYISAGRHGWWRILVVLSGLVVFVVLLATVAAKASVFVLISCIALFVLKARPAVLPTIAIGVVAALVLFSAVLIQGYIRNPDAGLLSSNPVLMRNTAFAQKLVIRQLVTSGCLQNVLEKRLHRPGRENPFYFVVAVVPRIFWSDKPNLSRGTRYARDYCGLEAISLGGDIPQNFSITLLGQPVIQAGVIGLITAQAFLFLALGFITLICLRTGGAGIITLVALLPWLSDFDQSLMLYIANASKMFLYMSPALVALVIATRRAPAADTLSAR